MPVSTPIYPTVGAAAGVSVFSGQGVGLHRSGCRSAAAYAYSIEDLHKMLKKHECHAVMVMDLQCLSDDPAELALIQKRFEDEHITLYELFATI